MRVAVVAKADEPAVTVQQARDLQAFGENDGDALIAGFLSAAQEEVDGPNGWYGWAIGEQTIELRFDCLPPPRFTLPYAPLQQVLSVHNVNGDDVGYVSSGALLSPAAGTFWPRSGLVVTYKAGFAAGTLPNTVKTAIVLLAAALRAAGPLNSTIQSEIVEGVGRTDYSLPGNAISAMRSTAEKLLEPTRIRRV